MLKKLWHWQRCRDVFTISNALAGFQIAVGVVFILQPGSSISPPLVREFFAGWPIMPRVDHIGMVMLSTGLLMAGRCMVGLDLFLFTIPLGIYGFITVWVSLWRAVRTPDRVIWLPVVFWIFLFVFIVVYIVENTRQKRTTYDA